MGFEIDDDKSQKSGGNNPTVSKEAVTGATLLETFIKA
jgi:hypothetical protein